MSETPPSNDVSVAGGKSNQRRETSAAAVDCITSVEERVHSRTQFLKANSLGAGERIFRLLARAKLESNGSGALEQVLSAPELNDAFFVGLNYEQLSTLCWQALDSLRTHRRGFPLSGSSRAALYLLMTASTSRLLHCDDLRFRSIGRKLAEKVQDCIAAEQASSLAYAAWHVFQAGKVDPAVPHSSSPSIDMIRFHLVQAVTEPAGARPATFSWCLNAGHPNTAVRDIVLEDGTVPLFRVIRGRYVPRHIEGAYTSYERAYSYSLNPYVCGFWKNYEVDMRDVDDQQCTVLVTFKLVGDPDAQACVPVFAEEARHCAQMWRPGGPLTPETTLGSLTVLHEVKVSIANENPAYAISLDRFKEIGERFRERPFTMTEFLAALELQCERI